MHHPSTAIVILNYNGRNYLEQFLPSVIASSYPNKRIIVADNASLDDSLLLLKNQFPAVEVVLLDSNYGFAGGYNQALKRIEADYYVLLNSDVEVAADWIEPVITLMEKDKKIAACQPKILSYFQKDTFEYAGGAGGWIDQLGYPFSRGRIFENCEKDTGQYNDTSEVFWATGAAMFVRAPVFHQLYGFDAFFFAHMEEIDLCWRMQLAGYKIMCCPASVVYHVGGGTLPKGNSRKVFLNFRNNLIMLFKNLNWKEKLWKLPLRILLDVVFAWKSLLQGDSISFFAVAKAHAAVIGWLVAAKHKHTFCKMPVNTMKAVYAGSIVWAYFIKKKRRFSEIVNKNL
ncbi:MAG TPA: glycosyltransferase family 2 protein [Panacibacter sp.]|nr:glycosyltransferase family 2 protein [Panacibacter sp.]